MKKFLLALVLLFTVGSAFAHGPHHYWYGYRGYGYGYYWGGAPVVIRRPIYYTTPTYYYSAPTYVVPQTYYYYQQHSYYYVPQTYYYGW